MTTQETITRLRDFRNEVNNLASLQKLMNDAADLLEKSSGGNISDSTQAIFGFSAKNVLEFECDLYMDNGYIKHPLGVMKHRMEYQSLHARIIWNYGKDAPDEDETIIGIWCTYGDDGSWELDDYDGVFELPPQAITLLEQCGIKVGEDFR